MCQRFLAPSCTADLANSRLFSEKPATGFAALVRSPSPSVLDAQTSPVGNPISSSVEARLPPNLHQRRA